MMLSGSAIVLSRIQHPREQFARHDDHVIVMLSKKSGKRISVDCHFPRSRIVWIWMKSWYMFAQASIHPAGACGDQPSFSLPM